MLFNEKVVSKGVGKSKKEAEQDAAKNYLFTHKLV
ncbi:MAG: putative dsRNA-binding protein [Eubacterium sp.]